MALSVLWLVALIGLAVGLDLRGYTFTHHPDLTQRAAVQKIVSPPFFCALRLFFYIEKGKYKSSTLADDTYPQGLMG